MQAISESNRVSRAIDAVLDAMGQPASLYFCVNLKDKVGIEINGIRSEKSVIYIEAVLKLMFGFGSEIFIQLLRSELAA